MFKIIGHSVYKENLLMLIFFFSFTEEELEAFHSLYNGHKVSETFIYNYEAADIAAVKLSTDSANVWSVSPPDRNRMLAEVNSSKIFYFNFE